MYKYIYCYHQSFASPLQKLLSGPSCSIIRPCRPVFLLRVHFINSCQVILLYCLDAIFLRCVVFVDTLVRMLANICFMCASPIVSAKKMIYKLYFHTYYNAYKINLPFSNTRKLDIVKCFLWIPFTFICCLDIVYPFNMGSVMMSRSRFLFWQTIILFAYNNLERLISKA